MRRQQKSNGKALVLGNWQVGRSKLMSGLGSQLKLSHQREVSAEPAAEFVVAASSMSHLTPFPTRQGRIENINYAPSER
jgi:hypothetical protein